MISSVKGGSVSPSPCGGGVGVGGYTGVRQILASQLTATHVTVCLSFFIVKSRVYPHQLGLDLAMNSGFKKRFIPPIMENSRGWQPRVCEVALINKALRGQVSCVLMAFIPVTSRLKMAPAIISVFQFSPYAWYSKRKEKRRKWQRRLQETTMWQLCLHPEYNHTAISSNKGRRRVTYCYLGQHSVQLKLGFYDYIRREK